MANKKDSIVEKEIKPVTKKTAKKLTPLAPFIAIGHYFRDSWHELKEVRWPDRKATWSMTAAVLLFSGFFVGLVVLLDAGFEALFNLIIN